MNNTKNLSEIITAVKNVYEAAQYNLGLKSVFVGDQELVPNTPCLCIEPQGVDRESTGLSFQTTNHFSLYLILYHGIIQDSQKNIQECLEFAELVSDELHKDVNKNLGGLLIHGYVTSSKAGIAPRNKNWWYATRMTYQGVSKTLLYN